MRQRRWLELIKDYELTISYHLGKANRVADALSRKTTTASKPNLNKQMADLNLDMVDSTDEVLVALVLAPTLIDRIKDAQRLDLELEKVKEKLKVEPSKKFQMKADGSLWMKGRLCVPKNEEIKRKILKEAYSTKFSIYLGGTKLH